MNSDSKQKKQYVRPRRERSEGKSKEGKNKYQSNEKKGGQIP